MVNGAEQVACRRESVVDDQRDVVLFSHRGDGVKIRDAELGVTDGFHVQGLCIFVDFFFKSLRTVPGCKTCLDPYAFKGNLKLVETSAIKKGRGNKIVPGTHDVGNGQKLGRLTRGSRQSGN